MVCQSVELGRDLKGQANLVSLIAEGQPELSASGEVSVKARLGSAQVLAGWRTKHGAGGELGVWFRLSPSGMKSRVSKRLAALGRFVSCCLLF